MAPVAARPETVLRRCDELLKLNQPQAAFTAISEVFQSRRFKSTPLSSLEPIMDRFLELCVQLKKGRQAKDGLHLFKNVAQNTSVAHVDAVIKKFLDLSKGRLQEAIKKVDEIEGPLPTAPSVDDSSKEQDKTGATVPTAEAEVEDLEASETPESILLSAVSEEKSRDRTYRTVVMPWLRFLWEAYRTSLDTLRNNARLEEFYQRIAGEAFDFCRSHQRKTEFRRLCETLRSHLASSQRHADRNYGINLSDADVLQRYLDTRFKQLNTAVDLELWQEAFRTAEDIHGLVTMSRLAPKPSMMAAYFEKLVQVFKVGNNFLFHAAAYAKLHSSLALIAGGTEQKVVHGQNATQVLLSALAVPVASDVQSRKRDGSVAEESEAAKNKAARLAALLGLSGPPSRAELLTDALHHGVLSQVNPELRSLYQILEVDFHPLSITQRIDPILRTLAADAHTAAYVEPLKDVVLARLFSQLGQVYDSISLDRAVQLGSFTGEGAAPSKLDRTRIERFIGAACRRGDLDVTFDHKGMVLNFDQDLFGSSQLAQQAPAESLLQPSPATLLRHQLSSVATTLFQALNVFDPTSSPVAQAEQHKQDAFKAMVENMANERSALLKRRDIIEQRKKQADELAARKEKEESAAKLLRAQERAAEQARQMAEDKKRQELERARATAAEIKAKEARELAQSLAQRSGVQLKTQEIEKLDPSELVQLSVQAMEKERKGLAEKIRIVGKRMDHVERAMRKEERPLIGQDYERQQARDRRAFEKAQSDRVAEAKAQHSRDLEDRNRLSAHWAMYTSFRAEREASSNAANEMALKESKARIDAEKSKRREHVRATRAEEARQRAAEEEAARAREEEDRRLAEERAAAEADRRAAEEAAAEEAREREEKEAAEKAAEVEKRRAERDAERAKTDLQSQRQREREAEIEARMAAGKRGGSAAVPGSAAWSRGSAAPPSSAAPASSSGERPRLNLQARTKPVEQQQPAAAAPPATNGASAGGYVPPGRRAGATPAAGSAPPAAAAASKDNDSFQTVSSNKSGGGGSRYVPPSQRNASSGSTPRGGSGGRCYV